MEAVSVRSLPSSQLPLRWWLPSLLPKTLLRRTSPSASKTSGSPEPDLTAQMTAHGMSLESFVLRFETTNGYDMVPANENPLMLHHTWPLGAEHGVGGIGASH